MSELIPNPACFAPGTMPDVFTIDVEDWFHILEVEGTPDLSSWDSLPTRLESNLRFLLDLLVFDLLFDWLLDLLMFDL